MMIHVKASPESPAEVLEIIVKAERSKKYVWTAGRVVMLGATKALLAELDPQERKLVLQRLTFFLEDLAGQGLLQRRFIPQSIGYGNESGFDFVHAESSNQAT